MAVVDFKTICQQVVLIQRFPERLRLQAAWRECGRNFKQKNENALSFFCPHPGPGYPGVPAGPRRGWEVSTSGAVWTFLGYGVVKVPGLFIVSLWRLLVGVEVRSPRVVVDTCVAWVSRTTGAPSCFMSLGERTAKWVTLCVTGHLLGCPLALPDMECV